MRAKFIIKYSRWWNRFEEEAFDSYDEAYERYKELKSGGYDVVQVRKEYVLDISVEIEDKYKGEIK